MSKRTRYFPTVDDITRVIDIRCGVCHAQGKLYPYPEGAGTMVCSNCSPVWLDSFVKFASEKLREDLIKRLHHNEKEAIK